ncbi:MAG: F0F1 ATP synthase subunit alpha [Patescibacteria group bacterium]|nr:F0F1 ATP synthase subunit alpha [Patescibacteria group bacterium]
MSEQQLIIEKLRREIEKTQSEIKVSNVGQVIKVADGIAQISGLTDVMASEILEFPNNVLGLALNLEETSVGAIILGEWEKIKSGDLVKTTGRVLSVPVGDDLLGRVVNPLGEPLDGKGSIRQEKFYPIEKIAPKVMEREPVNTPLHTGIKAIDTMIPIGRGQRELIIGDRKIGKTAFSLGLILNQKQDMFPTPVCIYVAIGQKESKIAKIVADLEKAGSMEHTIVVSASSSSSASLCYLAPFAGCAIGEYFMDKGRDALVIYDDLSKHAQSYRQISLLLRRSPGREAYPGDVFYLHSRLLERACKLNKEKGGGSLTALPIVETQAGDISSYIPTNIISITDGQIYFESELFYQGKRPALNVGLSVSRVGSKAQTKAINSVSKSLRLDLAQYRELAAFVQFGQELDKSTQQRIERGKRITEVLNQDVYKPMCFEKQVPIIWAAVKGHIDSIPVEKIQEFEKRFLGHLENRYPSIFSEIRKKMDLTEDIEKELKKAVEEFKNYF